MWQSANAAVATALAAGGDKSGVRGLIRFPRAVSSCTRGRLWQAGLLSLILLTTVFYLLAIMKHPYIQFFRSKFTTEVDYRRNKTNVSCF